MTNLTWLTHQLCVSISTDTYLYVIYHIIQANHTKCFNQNYCYTSICFYLNAASINMSHSENNSSKWIIFSVSLKFYENILCTRNPWVEMPNRSDVIRHFVFYISHCIENVLSYFCIFIHVRLFKLNVIYIIWLNIKYLLQNYCILLFNGVEADVNLPDIRSIM